MRLVLEQQQKYLQSFINNATSGFYWSTFVYSRFFSKDCVFLLAKSVNFDLQIPQKCISDTVFDFKAYIVHRLPREYYGLVTKHIKSHHPYWCIKVSNTPPWLPCWCSYYFFFCNQTWQGQSVMFSLKLLLKKKLYGLFLWMGFNCLKATQSLQGDSLLFPTGSPGLPGTHLVDLRRIKGWVDLGATQQFWTW